jgi:hypothetical protein
VTTESCREWRGELAAAALGNLDADAHVALQAHLDGCAACRAELDDLRAVAAVLPLADVNHVADAGRDEPPAELGERVLGRLAWQRADERRHHRRRIGVVVATAAIAVAAAIGMLFIGGSLSHSSSADRHVAFTTTPPGVNASVDLARADYGTEVELSVDGLDDGEVYWLWLTGDDGRRVAAGTFEATGSHYTCDMTAALPLDRARRVWVTDEEDRTVLDTGLAPELAPDHDAADA